MVIGAVATKKEIYCLQVGLPMQGGAFRVGRYQVQDEASGQRILLEGRHRLQQDFLSHHQVYFHQGATEYRSSSRLGTGADGCQDGISLWTSGREHLHGAATWVLRARSRREGLFVVEIMVRNEAIVEVMVQMI